MDDHGRTEIHHGNVFFFLYAIVRMREGTNNIKPIPYYTKMLVKRHVVVESFRKYFFFQKSFSATLTYLIPIW